MENRALFVIVFPEDVDQDKFNALRDAAKSTFSELGARFHLATKGAAETILFFVENGELPVEEGEDGNLVSHARRELEKLGNDEEFNASIIAAVKAFSSYGHSGGSASVAIPLLNNLLNYKNLSPLTDDPKEWNNVSDISGEELWQSSRCADAFSHDGGKTYYLLSEGATGPNPHPTHESEKVVS